MSPLPRYLIVDMHWILPSLDRLVSNAELPTIDLDAILSGMVELVGRPGLTGRLLDDAVRWLLTEHGLNSLHLEDEDAEQAQASFYACLIIMSQDLQSLNPYIDGRLPYRYKERHGHHAAIFEKYDTDYD